MASKRKGQIVVYNVLSAILSILLFPTMLLSYAIWLKILLSIIIFGLNCVIVLASYKSYKALQHKLEEELKRATEKKKKNLSLLDAYGILGISPQYNSDGSLKNVFELLKIKPEYDSNGNRLPTIYERLGINPRLTQFGLEIPFVFRIKNKINALVKAKEGTIPLFYVPRKKLTKGTEPYIPIAQGSAAKQDANAQKQNPIIQIQKLAKKPAAKKGGGQLTYPTARKASKPDKNLKTKLLALTKEIKLDTNKKASVFDTKSESVNNIKVKDEKVSTAPETNLDLGDIFKQSDVVKTHTGKSEDKQKITQSKSEVILVESTKAKNETLKEEINNTSHQQNVSEEIHGAENKELSQKVISKSETEDISERNL